jgi:hypothetical protein
MNNFDDFQIEESIDFDFVEASYDGIFDEDEDDRTFNAFLASNWDF